MPLRYRFRYCRKNPALLVSEDNARKTRRRENFLRTHTPKPNCFLEKAPSLKLRTLNKVAADFALADDSPAFSFFVHGFSVKFACKVTVFPCENFFLLRFLIPLLKKSIHFRQESRSKKSLKRNWFSLPKKVYNFVWGFLPEDFLLSESVVTKPDPDISFPVRDRLKKKRRNDYLRLFSVSLFLRL